MWTGTFSFYFLSITYIQCTLTIEHVSGNNTGYWMMDAVFLYVWASYKWAKEPEHMVGDALSGSNDDELEPLQKHDYICEDTEGVQDIMWGSLKMSHFSAFAHFNKIKHD